MTQSQLLIKAFFLIIKSGIFPKTSIKDWPKLLLFLHNKGYLYVGFEEELLKVVVCAYRVKEEIKSFPERYPEKEEGDILYIPWMVSYAKDKLLPKKLLNQYLKRNPNIIKIIFQDLKDNEKTKVFTRKQEVTHGKR